jgi:hypothetical protein
MFNIRRKVYVALDPEVDFSTSRTIIMHKQLNSDYFEFNADMYGSKTSIGVCTKGESFADVAKREFKRDYIRFMTWLSQEEKLLVVTDADSYKRMLSVHLLYLQYSFKLTNEELDKIVEYQMLKDYIQDNSKIDFTTVFNLMRTEYNPTGKLHPVNDIESLPFELVYAFYKWGKIDKKTANIKMASMAGELLRGHVHNTMENAKLQLGVDFNLLNRYLEREDITTVSQAIDAVEENAFLRKAFKPNCEFDFNNNLEYTEAIKICEIAIDLDLDHDSDPTDDLAELNFFTELFKKKDITIIDKAKYNYLSTGFIASRANKINGPLFMNT